MLLEHRTLWGAIASLPATDERVSRILQGAEDIAPAGRPASRASGNVRALRCKLVTSVQYTHDERLLNACAIRSRKNVYAFEFLCASMATPSRCYYCFYVPFRRMLGGVLRRISKPLRGRGCQWHKLEIMRTVDLFRKRPSTSPKRSVVNPMLCGVDLHLLAGQGEQEIIFIGMNPAQNRVFKAVAEETSDFTLSPISATFCVGATARASDAELSYFTIDRGGVVNVGV